MVTLKKKKRNLEVRTEEALHSQQRASFVFPKAELLKQSNTVLPVHSVTGGAGRGGVSRGAVRRAAGRFELGSTQSGSAS